MESTITFDTQFKTALNVKYKKRMQQLSKYGLICFCTEMNLLARNNCNANFKQTVSSIFLKLTWKQNSLPKIKYRTSSWKTSWRREPCRKTAHNKTWKWKSGIVSLSSYGFFFHKIISGEWFVPDTIILQQILIFFCIIITQCCRAIVPIAC